MKLGLILAGLTAGVWLMFVTLRAKSSLDGQTTDKVFNVQPSSQKHDAASANLAAANELTAGIVRHDESGAAAKAALL